MSATVVPRRRIPPLALQLVRFGLVGATNTALTLVTYVALVGLHAPVALAGAAGWGVGAVNGYRLNCAWTFGGAARGAIPAARYGAVQLMGSGLNALLVGIAVGHEHLPRLVGELVVLPPVTVLTFVLCRGWVFARAVPA
jgi:putative flippase GtrA